MSVEEQTHSPVPAAGMLGARASHSVQQPGGTHTQPQSGIAGTAGVSAPGAWGSGFGVPSITPPTAMPPAGADTPPTAPSAVITRLKQTAIAYQASAAALADARFDLGGAIDAANTAGVPLRRIAEEIEVSTVQALRLRREYRGEEPR